MNVNKLVLSVLSITTLLLFIGCKSSEPTSKIDKTPKTAMGSYALPPVIIYKTVKDFSNFVPVTMNDNKTKIMSYPAITDIKPTAKPTELFNGYLLDNRGITKNVAFLKYTYEDYAKLPSTPTADELLKCIINKNPLLEIYNCGQTSDYKDLIKELNLKIKEAGNEMDKFFTPIK